MSLNESVLIHRKWNLETAGIETLVYKSAQEDELHKYDTVLWFTGVIHPIDQLDELLLKVLHASDKHFIHKRSCGAEKSFHTQEEEGDLAAQIKRGTLATSALHLPPILWFCRSSTNNSGF